MQEQHKEVVEIIDRKKELENEINMLRQQISDKTNDIHQI